MEKKEIKGVSPGRELVKTVTGSNLKDVIFDAAEVALDNNLAEGVLKELPIVGAVVKLAQAGQSISEALFVRKLMRFLSELKNVPEEERARLLEEYPDSSDKQKVLGENLLLALERLDDIEKPEILARFFSAYIKSEIDYVTFTRLVRALERFNLALKDNLISFYNKEVPGVVLSFEIIHELSLSGLVIAGLEEAGLIDGESRYLHSSLGKEFLRLGFGVEAKVIGPY